MPSLNALSCSGAKASLKLKPLTDFESEKRTFSLSANDGGMHDHVLALRKRGCILHLGALPLLFSAFQAKRRRQTAHQAKSRQPTPVERTSARPRKSGPLPER